MNFDEKQALAQDGFVSIREACEFLSLGETKVYELMDNGELPFCKFGRARRIPRRALIEYAARKIRGGWQKASGNDF